jgi:hypothetical protein
MRGHWGHQGDIPKCPPTCRLFIYARVPANVPTGLSVFNGLRVKMSPMSPRCPRKCPRLAYRNRAPARLRKQTIRDNPQRGFIPSLVKGLRS